MSEDQNELGVEPNPVQKKVNIVSSMYGITSDFEGWYARAGDTVLVWPLNDADYGGLQKIRKAKRRHEQMQQALQFGVPFKPEGAEEAQMLIDSDLEDDADEFARLVHKTATNCTDKDLETLLKHPKGGRGLVQESATGLYVFLMRVTTRHAARHLMKPAEDAPSISSIKQGSKKSKDSTS